MLTNNTYEYKKIDTLAIVERNTCLAYWIRVQGRIKDLFSLKNNPCKLNPYFRSISHTAGHTQSLAAMRPPPSPCLLGRSPAQLIAAFVLLSVQVQMRSGIDSDVMIFR